MNRFFRCFYLYHLVYIIFMLILTRLYCLSIMRSKSVSQMSFRKRKRMLFKTNILSKELTINILRDFFNKQNLNLTNIYNLLQIQQIKQFQESKYLNIKTESVKKMNLKDHNDIVQKLLQKINIKDKQITQLTKQSLKNLKQSQINIRPNIQSVQIQKQIQKRIAQLNKQHKSKVDQLNQQIKNLNQQNKELKERVNLKNNIQQKQKEHVVEVMKKNFDRKAGTPYDHKVAALITHYDQEINKKNTYIQTLKRQIKSLSYKSSGKSSQTIDSSPKIQQEQIQNSQCTKSTIPSNILQQIQNLEISNKKLRKSYEQKCSQVKDLRIKYNQLTKQYYRVVNEYGATHTTFMKDQFQTKKSNSKVDQTISKLTISNNDNVLTNRSKFKNINTQKMQKSSQSPLSNILSGVLNDEEQDVSISANFQQKFKKFTNRPKVQKQNQDQDQEINYSISQMSHDQTLNRQANELVQNIDSSNSQLQGFFQQIKDMLNLSSMHDILHYLSNFRAQQNDIQLYDHILRKLHEIFYKFGMGKVSKTDMPQALQQFQTKLVKWVQCNELLDQICIQIGAKRVKVLQKLSQLKQSQMQFSLILKKVQFLNQLNKSNKVLQFIQFFQLDRSELTLPQQLKNIYQQLKIVDRFVKQANMNLNIQLRQTKGLETTLQMVLRKMEKYGQWEQAINKQNQSLKRKNH